MKTISFHYIIFPLAAVYTYSKSLAQEASLIRTEAHDKSKTQRHHQERVVEVRVIYKAHDEIEVKAIIHKLGSLNITLDFVQISLHECVSIP